MSPVIQSILLNKDKFTLKQAVNYMVKHNYLVDKVDETDRFYRFRQVTPSLLKKNGYTTFRTKVIVPNEIEFIFAYR